ncbi:MAG: sensor histidine kinase [Actinomycetia bacterium]|nr:sensor histidine kinase [Actinomycetes bacterium]
MTPPSQDRFERIDDRMQFFVTILPYLLLVATLPVALVAAEPIGNSRTDVTVMLTLSAATLVWIWWWTTAHPQWRTDQPKMAVYYAVRTVIAFVLTWINPFFAFFAWVGYVDALEFFSPRRAWLAIAATASIVAGSQIGGLPPDGVQAWVGYAAIFLVNFGLVCALSYFEQHRERDNVRRREVIAELERTNAQLESALSENAGLQAQLVIQAREAGTNEERQRLAREIHDTIAQGFAGIVTQLEAAVESPTKGDERQHVQRAAELARDGLNDARRSVRNLNPTELENVVLSEALKKLADTWSRWWNTRTDITVTGTVEPLHDEIEATLLRVAQEALTNVAKHASASRVGVTLSYMGDDVSLDIRDDGIGFTPGGPDGGAAHEQSHGFGLAGMRQRIERIAGRLDIETEPGGGTAVSAQVPSVVRDA